MAVNKGIPKKRGRPATGRDPLVTARLPPEMVAAIDAFARAEDTNRSDAIRRLVGEALDAQPKVRKR